MSKTTCFLPIISGAFVKRLHDSKLPSMNFRREIQIKLKFDGSGCLLTIFRDLQKTSAIGLLTKSTKDRLASRWLEMSISVKLIFQFYTEVELLKVAAGTIDATPTLLGLS